MGFKNQRQEMCCACVGSRTFIPILWMGKKQTAVFHSSAESEVTSLDATLRIGWFTSSSIWGVRVGNIVSVKTLSVISAIESFRLIHILTLVYLSPLTTFRPIFPTALIQPNFTSSKTMRGTHRVDLDWLFERLNLDHSMSIKCVRTNDRLADLLTTGMFTTMQWQ